MSNVPLDAFDGNLLPILEPIITILDRANAVQQQQIIEFLMVRHVCRMNDNAFGLIVIESMFKHIRQLYSCKDDTL